MKSLLHMMLPAYERRAARQTIWIGGIIAVQILASIVQVALSARILGPEGFGVLAVIIAATGLLFRLLSLPGDEVITTYVRRDLSEGRVDQAAGTLRFAFAASQALALAGYIALVGTALTLSGLLGVAEGYTTEVVVYGVSGLALATSGESMATLRLADRVRLGFAVAVISALARVGILVAAWQTGGGLLLVVLAYVAGDAVTGIGMFIAAAVSERKAALPGFLRSLRVRTPGRDVIAFQVGTFWRSSIEGLILHIDVLLIANMVSVAQVGLYRAAYQIVDSTKNPFRAVSVGVQAEYSRQWYGGNGAAVRRIARNFTLLSLSLAAAGYALLVIFHEPIIRLMLGSGFEGAARPLLFLIPGALAFACVAPLYTLPAATGRSLPRLAATAAALAAMTAALVALAPRYGAEGAAWANSIGWLVLAAVMIPFVISALRRTRRLPSLEPAEERSA